MSREVKYQKLQFMTEMGHHFEYYKVPNKFPLFIVWRIYSGNVRCSTNMHPVKCFLYVAGLYLTFAFGMLRI